MKCRYTRRDLLGGALGAAAGAALSREERALGGAPPASQPAGAASPKVKANSRNTLPTGRLGELDISRVILGGNLIAGFAHCREMVYVSRLVKEYHTEAKIFETLALAEAHGINCINTNSQHLWLIPKYRRECGSKIRWIVQIYPTEAKPTEDAQRALDVGADAIYVQGNIADSMVAKGKLDVLDAVFRWGQVQKMLVGTAAHDLAVLVACQRGGLQPDFYVKTYHTADYPSFHYDPPRDNCWCADAKAVEQFMAKVERPWVAYKIMAAGAIPPKPAFERAFAAGADFALAGMFDFQVAADVEIAKAALQKAKGRSRPWRA